jgi:hypothetical protein
MNKEKLWIIYIEKNPKFMQEDAHITFTAKGLRQFFERTFDYAFEAGKTQEKKEKSLMEKAFGKNPSGPGEESSNFDDIFGSLFGKKR